jgi:hypothetical protein
MKNNHEAQNERATIDIDTATLLGLVFGVLLHLLILFAALMVPAAAQADVGDFRSWGVGGRAQFSVGTGADVMPSDVIALRGGALLVATSCNEQPSRDWCFTKLNFNGSVDTTWGTNNSGSVMEITPAQDFVRGMLPLDDGG